MNETLHANIFFFITSVAVVAVTLMLVVVLWYVISILREVRKVATKVSQASEGLERDLEFIRAEVRSNIGKLAGFVSTVGGFFLGGLTKKKRPATKKRSESETETGDSV